MRQAELRSLKLSSFETIEGIRFMSYVGKGQKMNRVPIHPTTAHYLDEYQKWMAMIGRPIKDSDYFFQPTKNSHG
jgi:site-specific recombinase XerC